MKNVESSSSSSGTSSLDSSNASSSDSSTDIEGKFPFTEIDKTQHHYGFKWYGDVQDTTKENDQEES